MKKIVLSMAIVCTFTNSQAQEFFSDKRPVQTEAEFTRKVNDISYDIDVIIKTNKDQLKEELNKIEKCSEVKFRHMFINILLIIKFSSILKFLILFESNKNKQEYSDKSGL